MTAVKRRPTLFERLLLLVVFLLVVLLLVLLLLLFASLVGLPNPLQNRDEL